MPQGGSSPARPPASPRDPAPDSSLTLRERELVARLLHDTSRTFALAIPLLEPPLRDRVGVAYLLFRIADSIEDAPMPGNDRKRRLLTRLQRQVDRVGEGREVDEDLEGLAAEGAQLWPQAPKIRALFEATPPLFSMLRRGGAAEVICRSLSRTIGGMQKYLTDGEADDGAVGDIQLRTLEELWEYCYYVAGVVGEMLSELFLLERPGQAGSRERLLSRGRQFGECLQLTNILKDAEQDAAGRRHLLPSADDRPRVFSQAYQSAAGAREYLAMLRRGGFPGHIVRFCELPLRLAELTLPLVEQAGAGAKLSRGEVLAALRDVSL